MTDKTTIATQLKGSIDTFVAELQKKAESSTLKKILIIEKFTYRNIGLRGKLILYREEMHQSYTVAFIFRSNKVDKAVEVSARITDLFLADNDITLREAARTKIREAVMEHLIGEMSFDPEKSVSGILF